MGGVQAVSGAASIVFAAALTTTGVGAPVALGIAALGFDNLQAGSQALLNNQPARTLGGQALELTGLSSENAELAYSIFDLAATIKVIRLALTKGGYKVLQVNIGSGRVDRIKLIRAKINQRHTLVAGELKVNETASVVNEEIDALRRIAANPKGPDLSQKPAGSILAMQEAKGAKGTVQYAQTISKQKQMRHIQGTAPQNKSYFDSLEDAQKVLDAYNSGNYRFISENVKQSTVVIEVKNVSGTYINVGNPNGLPDVIKPTNVFMIQSSGSPKIVPVNPNKGK